MMPYRTTSKVLEEVDTSREDNADRKPYEWEDLIVGIAQSLTVSKLQVKGTGPLGQGEQYAVVPADDYRKRLVDIAGLALAAIESYDRQVLAANAVRATAKPPEPTT